MQIALMHKDQAALWVNGCTSMSNPIEMSYSTPDYVRCCLPLQLLISTGADQTEQKRCEILISVRGEKTALCTYAVWSVGMCNESEHAVIPH